MIVTIIVLSVISAVLTLLSVGAIKYSVTVEKKLKKAKYESTFWKDKVDEIESELEFHQVREINIGE